MTQSLNSLETSLVMQDIIKQLLKYFSRSHKKHARLLMDRLMLDKVTSVEFRGLYAGLTDDCTFLIS